MTGVRALLGEGPIWHAADHAVYWVDIYGERVFRHDPTSRETSTVLVGTMVTALAETSGGGLLGVTGDGLVSIDDGRAETVAGYETSDTVRTNDGKCDPWGRMWFGTMDLETHRPIATLFRFDTGLHHVIDGVVLSNGLGWSPDGATFYHIDSVPGSITAYDHDPDTGDIANGRLLVDFSDRPATPDGMAIDAVGNLWVALWDGWGIDVYSPEGIRIDHIGLPVQRPTCPVFGGDGLDLLYITSATDGLDPSRLSEQPAAGELIVIEPGVKGLPGGVFPLG